MIFEENISCQNLFWRDRKSAAVNLEETESFSNPLGNLTVQSHAV